MKKLLFILLVASLYSCNNQEAANNTQYEFYSNEGIKVENVNLMNSLKKENKLYRLDLNTNKLELY